MNMFHKFNYIHLESSTIKVGVLTSSRADYGVYLPLLKELEESSSWDLEVIAYGMHTSSIFGDSVRNIEKDGFGRIHKINTLLDGDSPAHIAASYANTIKQFGAFWAENSFDLVISLGDRYEMNAAVQASIPFRINLAHIHGGETTLGAIDNIYRHQISLASNYHFCSTQEYAARIFQLVGKEAKVEVVGALGLDNLESFEAMPYQKWKNHFDLDGLEESYILMTVHPETVAWERNLDFATELRKSIEELQETYQILITMPNADTMGSVFRNLFSEMKELFPDRIYLIENFGTEGYFNAMHYSSIMLGNTSSGIAEGASFGNYVINIGDRQKGRIAGPNVVHTPFHSVAIVNSVQELMSQSPYEGSNIFYVGGAARRIVASLENSMFNTNQPTP